MGLARESPIGACATSYAICRQQKDLQQAVNNGNTVTRDLLSNQYRHDLGDGARSHSRRAP